MNRPGVTEFLTVTLALAIWGNSARAEDLTTASGKVFRNIEIRDLDCDAITVSHSGGVTKIPLRELTSEIQKRFSPLELFKELRRTTAELENIKRALGAAHGETAQTAPASGLSDRPTAAARPAASPALMKPIPPVAQLPPFQAGDVVDADEIAHHYRTEPATADLRYKKKVFRVRGKIERFEEKMFIRKTVVVLDTPEKSHRIVCEVPFPDGFSAVYRAKGGQVLVGITKSRREVRLMEVGELVVFKGKCAGSQSHGIVFSQCERVQ